MNEERFFRDSRPVVEETFTPIFLNELDVNNEVAMTCEENPQCIFDLTATGDMDVAMNALNHEKETNLTEDTISKTATGNSYQKYSLDSSFTANFPPNISADMVFSVTLGQESAYTILVEDQGDEITLAVLGGLPPNSALDHIGEKEYILRWNLQEVTTDSLTFFANDSNGASSTFTPIVEICACANGGICTRDGLLSTNATTILNCICHEGMYHDYIFIHFMHLLCVSSL